MYMAKKVEDGVYQDKTMKLVGDYRDKIQKLAGDMIKLKNVAIKESRDSSQEDNETVGEQIANIVLSYRHLEDARMRLGKVLQARIGGISIYDKQ
jgi:UDP-N-acetylglucosamine 2-epimerase